MESATTEAQPGRNCFIRGWITIDRDLTAGTKLWLTDWTKMIVGGEIVSLIVEIADEVGRANP
jgi:hypothetical protein